MCHPIPTARSMVHMPEEEVVDLFWTESEDFRNQRGEFGNLARFKSKEASAGKSHLWYEKYSLYYTKVLGFVACRVTSKNGGIGPGVVGGM